MPRLDPTVWDAVDWTKDLSTIAEELGCSYEAARQQRAKRGVDPPVKEIETPGDDATLRQNLGWRVRLHRLRLGLTLESLAVRVNKAANGSAWQHGSISGVERAAEGMRGVSLPGLWHFAKALKVTPAGLLLLPGQTELTELPDLGKDTAAELGALRSSDPRIVVGWNIARWRLYSGWSLLDLADRVHEAGGLAPHSTRIRKIEAGEYWLTIEMLAVFADALEVFPADLVRLKKQVGLTEIETG
jgi:transcriptional regulator with XRE-family HTH domain